MHNYIDNKGENTKDIHLHEKKGNLNLYDWLEYCAEVYIIENSIIVKIWTKKEPFSFYHKVLEPPGTDSCHCHLL